MKHEFNRRVFLQTAGAGGSAFVVGIQLPLALGSRASAQGREISPNAWLRITSDGRFVFILDRVEMGQGVMTALPMILAEELDVNPQRFVIEHAPASREYDNPDLGVQVTGGSSSVHAAIAAQRSKPRPR